MSDRTAEAEVLWDALHALGQEAATLAALLRARPELLHEALGMALSEERRTTSSEGPHPLRDATFVAGPWEVLLEDESWARFDLARNEPCAEVEQWLTPTGDNRSPWRAYLLHDGSVMEVGTYDTPRAAQEAADATLTKGTKLRRWRLY